MSLERKLAQRGKRRELRVRKHVKAHGTLPRVTVFRSLKQIYAQLINDAEHKTITSCSSLEFKEKLGGKKVTARAVGLELAKRAREQGVQAAYFDRGSFLYHGRVKALVEGLREGGLTI